MPEFTVDTHLFRELGELLVGRDSTALVELIKNSYDADATIVTVYGENLEDTQRGRIVISDDGIGMTRHVFENGFLRIASRIKEEGERRSPKFSRRFTGAKGVGRLAAHKLARYMAITSIPDPQTYSSQPRSIEGVINWDAVESCATLNEIGASDALSLEDYPVGKDSEPGTVIELERLRRKWTAAERARFFWEVQTFRPPKTLVTLPEGLINNEPLIRDLRIADADRQDPGFKVELVGDLASGEEYWEALAHAASWVIEIDARKTPKRLVRYSFSPTARCLNASENAEPIQYTIDFPEPTDGPYFHARILVREGHTEGIKRHMRTWIGRASGIRVYMEGFRVLPYGQPSDDWLDLAADYKRRSRTLQYLEQFEVSGEGSIDPDEGLGVLGNDGYFGAVFLTLNRSPELNMLVNREGFIPNAAFDTLKRIVRIGIDFSVRIRAALSAEKRDERRKSRLESRQHAGKPVESVLDLKQELQAEVIRATELAQQARQEAASGNIEEATRLVDTAASTFSAGARASEDLLTEPSVTRMLAAVGTQMAAFVHEVNGLLGMAASLEEAMSRLRKRRGLGTEVRTALADVAARLSELRRSVEKQASYLSDITSPDARRRRTRQKVSDRFDASARLVRPRAERLDIEIENAIPRSLRTCPMFPAELTLVFSNLLTNAVKHAGKGGTIKASGMSEGPFVVVIVGNTGTRVNVQDSERWFRPFESTTENPDPYLGQGMGMGLPLTRNMLEEYGGTVRFVSPPEGFATMVRVDIPKG